MSHCFVKGIDVIVTPRETEFATTWHGNEEQSDDMSLENPLVKKTLCPIKEVGLKPDFDCEVSTFTPEEIEAMGENPMEELKDYKLLVADLRQNEHPAKKVIPLHVPRKGYKVHQNLTLAQSGLQAAEKVLGKDGFLVATIGTLAAYTQFILSIFIKGVHSSFEIGQGDKYQNFFNIISSHNGLVGSQSMLSIVRMVCMNTVQAAIADADTTGLRSVIKHTINSEALITPEKFESDLKLWIDQKQSFINALNSFKGYSMTPDTFKSFASGVFTQEGSDALSTTSYNRVEEMVALFNRGKGNAGVSLYDAINAFTEYFTHGNGVGNSTRVNQNKRIASANFGRGNDWKLEAIRIASIEEELTACLKRGERFYNDYLLGKAKGATVSGSDVPKEEPSKAPEQSEPVTPEASTPEAKQEPITPEVKASDDKPKAKAKSTKKSGKAKAKASKKS